MRWYAASDHAGLSLRRPLVARLRELGDEVIDLGTDADVSVDYPEFGAAVGRSVAELSGSFAAIHDTRRPAERPGA